MENDMSRAKHERDQNKLLVKQSKELIEEMRKKQQVMADEAKSLMEQQKS